MTENGGMYIMGVGSDPWFCDCTHQHCLESKRAPAEEGETTRCTLCETVWTAKFLRHETPLGLLKAAGNVARDATEALCWWRPDRVEA